jgi:hypothetical protein
MFFDQQPPRVLMADARAIGPKRRLYAKLAPADRLCKTKVIPSFHEHDNVFHRSDPGVGAG